MSYFVTNIEHVLILGKLDPYLSFRTLWNDEIQYAPSSNT